MNEAQQLPAHADHGRAPEHGHVAHSADTHAHPGPAQYVAIALILGVITAVEVVLFYIEGLPNWALTTSLLILSLGKFSLVVLYFMHLKFDNRLFSALFVSFLVVTIGAFIAVLAMARVLF